MVPPLAAGSQRLLTMRYTGKAHCVSTKWIREYQIDKYAVALRVLPLTGNLTAIAKLDLLGTGETPPNEPRPHLPKGIKAPKHWVPPLLQQGRSPDLGLVLNDEYAVDDVTLSGRQTPYSHTGGVLQVPLATAIAKGQRLPVQIRYTGKVRNSERNRIWDNFDNEPAPVNPLGAE